ncbi:hypothetical protein Poli38472_012606 [Pythium oligandrum]|uniref:Uncharacterized protein n=1 Tax=Pythium oligandrum TaxID=41045 RepID=A0A8K1CEN1_PYTOL|nr:hypothetical protein Poli38472_012606 [Pythium oligandrum]|eukprot:TMW61415.1 hypothetical protein Poli38472_012606 [Pythium oligandrum]
MNVPMAANAQTAKYDFCHRRVHKLESASNCPEGYAKSRIGSFCSMNCPSHYPIKCGPTCAAGGSSCKSLALRQAKKVTDMALFLATGGALGAIKKVLENFNKVKCPAKIASASIRAHFYATQNKPQRAVDKLQEAVAACIGASAITQPIVDYIKKTVEQYKATTKNPSDAFLELTAIGEVKKAIEKQQITPAELQKMNNVMANKQACGPAIQSVIDDVIDFIKDKRPQIRDINAMHEELIKSDHLLDKVPAVDKLCFPGNTPEREKLMKTIDTIIGGILAEAYIEADANTAKSQIALEVAKFGLDTIAIFDPSGIAALINSVVSEFCTSSSHAQAVDGELPVETDGNGFKVKKSMWTNEVANGKVNIRFTNSAKRAVGLKFYPVGPRCRLPRSPTPTHYRSRQWAGATESRSSQESRNSYRSFSVD